MIAKVQKQTQIMPAFADVFELETLEPRRKGKVALE